MATVKSWKELEKALMKARDEALKCTGEKTKELVKDRIDEDVYNAYPSPEIYERTGQLRDSVDVTDEKLGIKISQVTIGHDTSRIHHTSIVDGSSVGDSLPEIIHNGLTGAMMPDHKYWKDSPRYKSEHTFAQPRPYMDNAKKEMKDGKYKKFMKESLKEMGIDSE